jgi:hypothetical protein
LVQPVWEGLSRLSQGALDVVTYVNTVAELQGGVR